MPLLKIADLDQSQQTLAPYMAMAQDLKDRYFDHIANDQDESFSYTVDVFGSKTRSPDIHASEISQCQRLMVYSMLGTERIPETKNVNMQMRFRIGTAVHSMLQNDWHRIAKKSNGRVTFEDEVKINPSLGGPSEMWDLHSSCDGVVTIWEMSPDGVLVPAVKVGIEFKTASDKEFEKLRSPKSEHEEQTCFYMKALDIPLMWVFYYNKSNSNVSPSSAPYLFQFDHVLWDALEMRFVEGTHHVESGTLPDRKEGQQCDWCAYTHTCKPLKHQRQQQNQAPIVISQGMRSGARTRKP